jgi:iron complex transport system substrate-binding protein
VRRCDLPRTVTGARLRLQTEGQGAGLQVGTARRAGAALLLASFIGCGDTAPPARVGPPARVVSLAPSITEIVYGLGADARLVGACAQCNYPEAVLRLPRVGGFLTPSVEAVLGARPDLVIAVPSPGNREAVRAVERAGVRVLVVQDRTLADLWASMRSIADALGVAEAGERLVADTTAHLTAVGERVAGLPVRRVLVVVGHRPLVAVGGGTLQDELIRLAGGTNVAAEVGEVWPQVSLELVVALAPEVIVDATMGSDDASREVFAGLDTIPALREGRIVTLPDDTLFRAGPRVPAAAAALAHAIHPEAFKSAAEHG